MTTPHYPLTDPAFPQLDTALSAPRMRLLFAHELFPSREQRQRYQVSDCEILQARYTPGHGCLISYRLTIHDAETDESCEQILCGNLSEKTGTASPAANRTASPLVAPRFGKPVFHIPAPGMDVWTLPNEPKLSGLPAIMDPARLKNEILRPIVENAYGEGWNIASISSQFVHYAAERTCTVRVTMEVRCEDTREAETVVLYGKTYDNEDGAETFLRMQQLWESPAHQSGRLTMAQPLAYQAEIRTLWHTGLPGASLSEQEPIGGQFAETLPKAAVALAELHQTPVSCRSTVTLADLMRRAKEAEAIIVRARPDLTDRLRALTERLNRHRPVDESRPSVTLHGDLHLQNILLVGSRIALFDLDKLCHGDPLVDVASFLALLHYRNLLLRRSQAYGQGLINLFVKSYRAAAPWAKLTDSALAWHVACALLSERACRCVTRPQAERLTALDDLIGIAERLLADLEPSR